MLVNSFNPAIQSFKTGIKTTASRPLDTLAVGKSLLNANSTADTFLAVNKGITEATVKSNWLMKNASKGPLKYFGNFTNALSDMTIKGSNMIGNSIINAPSGSFIGKAASKIPFLSTIGNGLSKVSKLPGLATMFVAGEALWGIGKAINSGVHGKSKEASHQLIKSSVTLGAQLTGLALLAGGIIASPFTAGTSLAASIAGIGTLVGTDMAGRWIGEKIANTICGPIEKETAINTNIDYNCVNPIPSYDTIDDFINDLYSQPYMRNETNPFISFNTIG